MPLSHRVSAAKGPTWFTKNYKIVVFCLAIPGIYLAAVIDGYTTMANAATGAISTVMALAVVEGFDRQQRKRASDANGQRSPDDLTAVR